MNNQEITYEQLKELGEKFLKDTRPSKEQLEYSANIINSYEFIKGLLIAQKEKIERLEIQLNGGWIKCSDRLPKHGEVVLCTCRNGGITVSCITYKGAKTAKWVSFGQHYVAAWKPLPEPYKESEVT